MNFVTKVQSTHNGELQQQRTGIILNNCSFYNVSLENILSYDRIRNVLFSYCHDEGGGSLWGGEFFISFVLNITPSGWSLLFSQVERWPFPGVMYRKRGPQ